MQELLQRASRLHQAGELGGAADLYRQVLAAHPSEFNALYALALISLQAGRLEDAENSALSLTAAHPNVADGWNLLASVHGYLGRSEAALTAFGKALALDANLLVAHLGRTELLAQLGRFEEASLACREALSVDGNDRTAMRLLGQILLRLGQYEEAAEALRAFVAREPRDAGAFTDLGIVLSQLGRDSEALAAFDAALALAPDSAAALYNRGNLFCIAGRYREAAADCARAIALEPEFDFAYGTLLWARLQTNDWMDLDALRKTLATRIEAGKRVIIPQQYLSVATSAETLFACARNWSQSEYPEHPSPVWRGETYEHDRIRVAYMSADFAEHATAHWTAGVFERHDRKRFHVTAISLASDDGSAMRKRLEAAFDEFVDVDRMNDREIASLIREREIDILIDLKGYTRGSRMSVFAMRPAPVQVSYIGYPGPTGAGYMDYVLADRVVVPPEHFASFSEQIVWLPHTYVCNDDKRPAAGQVPVREDVGLPANGFVFCCFNANYKILPETFDSWMRILARTAGSVLWLLDPGAMAAANLRREAKARGVVEERLIFAPRMPIEEHLLRLGGADLVLDTLPYNAHTTAADALWTGVPVLTCIGTTFPGRVGASILRAIGMGELITETPQAFEDLACRLAEDGEELKRIRAKLARNRQTYPLFDTARFTRNLESAYLKMWEVYRSGSRPKAIEVGDLGPLPG